MPQDLPRKMCGRACFDGFPSKIRTDEYRLYLNGTDLRFKKLLIQNLIINLIVNHNPEFTAFRWMARLVSSRPG
jgi:hypothetical protein